MLDGGHGVDSLYASAGRDVLTGGTQADLFIFAFRAAPATYDSGLALAARDEITDFQIGLDDLRFVSFAGGTLSTVGGGAFTAANQLRWVVSGGNTTVLLNADADAAPEMAIILTGVTGLQASDFLL